MTALLMVPILAMVAFAVDVGHIALERTRLQAAADAAALAAAVHLPNPDRVNQAALEFAAWNDPGAKRVLALSDVEIGVWDADTRTFTPTGPSPSANAVRVTTRRSASNGNALKLIFAPILGRREIDVSTVAVAQAKKEFCGAVVGLDSVVVTGNGSTDSYDSSQGPYDPATAGSQAGMCSNGWIEMSGNGTVNGDLNTSDSIALTGDATVNGSAFYGPEHEIDMSGNAGVSGETRNTGEGVDEENYRARPYRPEPRWYTPSSDVPLTNSGNLAYQGGRLSLADDDVLELSGGSYHFRDISLSGNAVIHLRGDATLYVDQDFTVSGNAKFITHDPMTLYVDQDFSLSGNGIINVSQRPSDLQIYMTGALGEGRQMDVSGNGDLYAAVWAPNADVTYSGNGDLYGMLVGRTVELTGNGSIHYDESLPQNLSQSTTRASLVD